MTKKKPVTVPDTTPQAYNEVVDLANLIDIKLISSEFKASPVYYNSDAEELRRLYGCDQVSGAFDGASKFLIGMFSFEAGAKYKRKWALQVKSTYLIVFSIEGEPEEGAALNYLSRVGKFACYPYFRGHYAELCSAAGAEAPPLPVMRGNVPRKILKDVQGER